MSDAIRKGFIRFDMAHDYASLPYAARAWLERHYNDLPSANRPEREQIEAFGNLFSTYLESSFDLVRDPGQRLHSPQDHCFCPMCSWLVDLPHLRAKTVRTVDKKRANQLQDTYVRTLALELELQAAQADQVLQTTELAEAIALATYGRDLLGRLEGRAEGPATLALWRRFAWTRAGSPKPDFELTAAAILDGEAAIRDALTAGNRP
jgi:hypothetical protein